MKKQLLLLTIPLLLLTATLQAQIKYWDFGARELGAGYDNMLPVEYLNALSAKLRQIDWVDAGGNIVTNYADGVGYAAKSGYENENGECVESIFAAGGTYSYLYEPGVHPNFQITSQKNDGNGGIYISGVSPNTKPANLPDLDGTVNMGFMKDSNSDRIVTVNKDLTRYDERDVMPDEANPNLFPGCIQFTTPGEKRWDREGGRGFSMTLAAGAYLTVVGSGEYSQIDKDDPGQGFSTGTFQFATYGGTGTVVNIIDSGTGTGSPTGPIDGTDQGDESLRVMEFQAVDAGSYILRNRGGKIRIYRMYVSSNSIKNAVQAELDAALGVDDVASAVTTDVKAV
ncbi:MAG TPA: hypothetical protein VF985_08325, partial [Mariniflexile sp.]